MPTTLSVDSAARRANEAAVTVSVRVLRTIQDLESVRNAWETWGGSRDSELDYYLGVLRSNPETVRPHVIVVYRNEAPDAILVGRVDRKAVEFRVGYLSVRRRATILFFVYGAWRGNSSAENGDLLVDEIARNLSRREADAAYLNLLAKDSDMFRAATQRAGFFLRDHVYIFQSHYSASIPRTMDEFYSRLSSKSRWQIKSRGKKFVGAFPGRIKVRCFRDHSEVTEMFREVEEVAQLSYQRGLNVGFLNTDALRHRFQVAAQQQSLRGYVLYVDHRPVAFWLGCVNRLVFVSDYLGFDPAFTNYSPGTYLITKAIEALCSEHVVEIDFGPGPAQYKQVLGNRECQEAALYMYASSWKGLYLHLLRYTTSGVDNIGKTVLGRAHLLAKVKKYWRSRKQSTQATVTCL